MTYEEYLEIIHNIETKNKEYLQLFKQQLETENLQPQTMRTHLLNAEFYINEFLLRYQPYTMDVGCKEAHAFLTYFFPCKCAWASIRNMRVYKTSLRKFYGCMLQHQLIEQEDYDYLLHVLKDYDHEFVEAYYNRYRYFENLDDLS